MAQRKKPKPTRTASAPKHVPVGVWNRGTQKRGPVNPIRVRTKRLDEIQGDKIALAYWLLAKQIVENGTDEPLNELAVREAAADLDEASDGDAA